MGEDRRVRRTRTALYNALVALIGGYAVAAGRVRERASITRRKTGWPVRLEINELTRQSLERWIADPEMVGAEFLWPSRFHDSPHLKGRRDSRILRWSATQTAGGTCPG